jgi:hypothetical protein
MTTAIPSHSIIVPAFQHQPHLRALTRFDRLPAGCITLPMSDDLFAPHLRRGEFAVVDLDDTEPLPGEIFAIGYRDDRLDCGRRLALVELSCRMECRSTRGWECGTGLGEPEPCWWVHHECRTRVTAAAAFGHRPTTLTEGRFTTAHLRSSLVGRVIGFWLPAPTL